MATASATKLVTKAAACDRLGISTDTFDRHWARVFTDARTPGGHRRVYEDELEAAVSQADANRAKAAVARVRIQANRRTENSR